MKNNKYVRIIMDVVNLFSEKEMGICSGYATLYILMAMAPLLMLIISIINMMPWFTAEDASAFLFSLFPEIPQVHDMLESIITNLNSQSGSLIASVSAITTLWSASNALTAIQVALEKLHGTSRISLKGKPAALLFTVLYILLIPSLLVFQLMRDAITPILTSLFTRTGLTGFASQAAQFMHLSGIIALVLMIIVISLTYTYLPKGKRSWKSELPGSVFAGILCALFTLGFAYFIPRFWKLSSVYGSLAAVFLSAMWLQMIITILFYGAALNKVINNS